MLWTSSQQTVIDQFIQEIKTIGWFKQAGEPSENIGLSTRFGKLVILMAIKCSKFGDKIVSSSNKKHCDS